MDKQMTYWAQSIKRKFSQERSCIWPKAILTHIITRVIYYYVTAIFLFFLLRSSSFFFEVVFIFWGRLHFLRSSSFLIFCWGLNFVIFFWGRLHFLIFFEVVFIFYFFLRSSSFLFFLRSSSIFFWGRLSSWVKIRLHAENQPPRLSGSTLKV